MEELKDLLARKKSLDATGWSDPDMRIQWLMDVAEFQLRFSVGALAIANIQAGSAHYDIKKVERKLW